MTEGLTRECLHFLFNSEKKVRKKTPLETHGFKTSFPRFVAVDSGGIPRVDFCAENLV